MSKANRQSSRGTLSPERIEVTALDVIEQEGYEGFSMRKLAAQLGCEAMSIYHYFPSQAHLRDALLARCLNETVVPPKGTPWLDRLTMFAREYRAAALRHPSFFQHAALHRMNTAAGLAYLEGVIGIFRDAGFGMEDSARLFRTLGYYLIGAVLDEVAGYAKGPSAAEPIPPGDAERDYPLVTAVNPYFRPDQHEATFERGLKIMLDGIARAHQQAGLG